jgi:hypothetical protein
MGIGLVPSESKFLERSRIALVNAASNAEIMSRMAKFGMNEEKLLEGLSLHDRAKAVKDRHEKEGVDSRLASNAYRNLFEDQQALFKRHRDLVRIYFKRKPDVLTRLRVSGRLPTKYNEFFERCRTFYLVIQNNPDLQELVLPLDITPEVVADCLAKLDELLKARASFDKDTAEWQDATQEKNRILLELKEWMDDFDTIAKVALYDNPQLLEALGIFVRS